MYSLWSCKDLADLQPLLIYTYWGLQPLLMESISWWKTSADVQTAYDHVKIWLIYSLCWSTAFAVLQLLMIYSHCWYITYDVQPYHIQTPHCNLGHKEFEGKVCWIYYFNSAQEVIFFGSCQPYSVCCLRAAIYFSDFYCLSCNIFPVL